MTGFRIGIDAVKIERADKLSDHFISSFFHPNEAANAAKLSDERRAEYLASRFAAKEAFSKAMGTGLAGIHMKEIEVITEASGQPILVLHGETKKRFDQKFHLGQIEISLTHESPLALANVLIQYERDGSNV